MLTKHDLYTALVFELEDRGMENETAEEVADSVVERLAEDGAFDVDDDEQLAIQVVEVKMLKVNRFKTPMSQHDEKHRVVIETDSCVRGTLDSRMVRTELLRYLYEDPMFSQCGGVDFHSLKLHHDGTCWRAECEAVIKSQQF